MTLDYFYGQAGELFSFFRIPKALFQEQRFQNLSTDAKTLYGILLDRMSLSVKNEWFDKKGRVFIIFTIEDVKRTLRCADNKATRLLRELEEFGLIERKRRGQRRIHMEENTLSVLKIAPGQYPQQVEIDNDLKALQQAVGGSIGASYPFEDPVAIVYNDDGKLMGLPLNRALRDENGQMYDAVAGTFLVVGLGEEDFASLTPELAQKYEQLFHQPEAFLRASRWSAPQSTALPILQRATHTFW